MSDTEKVIEDNVEEHFKDEEEEHNEPLQQSLKKKPQETKKPRSKLQQESLIKARLKANQLRTELAESKMICGETPKPKVKKLTKTEQKIIQLKMKAGMIDKVMEDIETPRKEEVVKPIIEEIKKKEQKPIIEEIKKEEVVKPIIEEIKKEEVKPIIEKKKVAFDTTPPAPSSSPVIPTIVKKKPTFQRDADGFFSLG